MRRHRSKSVYRVTSGCFDDRRCAAGTSSGLLRGIGIASAILLLGAGQQAAAQTTQLTIAHFAAPQHPVSKWIESWTKEMEGKSKGSLSFRIIPNSQLGPITRYYDIARRGQADITWFLHGGTPGRFALTELTNLPFMFCSGEHASRVLNDPDLRAKYFDKEHEGVKVLQLHAHVPGHIWTARKQIKSVGDFKGLAIRPASRTIGAFVEALGAKPVSLPPTALAENMQKATIEGTFMDYPAGETSFKLGPVTKFIAETYAYTASLGFIMNEASWAKLSPEQKRIVTDTIKGREKEVGGAWDAVNGRSREALIKGGTTIARLSKAEFAALKQVGDKVTVDWVSALDKKGVKASAALADIKAAVVRTKPMSANFCQD